MRINHNISAFNAWRQIGITDHALSKSLERLSSGLRINRAADDAAGLAISEKMRAQINGLNQAIRNSQDAISLIQTAEGALNETHSILQRMRELAIQAANDTLTTADREEIQREINQLADELNRIANTTEFNTKKLLNGSLRGGTRAREVRDTDNSGGTPKSTPWVTTATVQLDENDNDITANDNELTFRFGGEQYTVVIAAANDQTAAQVAAALETAINNAIGADRIAVGLTADNRLTFTSTVSGSDPANKFEVIGGNFADEWIQGTDITEGYDKGDVWMHGETDGYTTGVRVITDALLATNNIVVDQANNELTLRLYNPDTGSWLEGTIVLGDETYDGTNATAQDLIADIQAELQNLGGVWEDVTVSYDIDKTLKFEATGLGAGSRIEVTGGSLMDDLMGAATDEHVRYTGESDNRTLTFSLDGASHSITLDEGSYDDAYAVAAQIQKQLDAQAIDATVKVIDDDGDGNGYIQITSNVTGQDAKNFGGSAAKELGLDGAETDELTFHIGANKDQTLSVTIGDVSAAALGITSKNRDAKSFNGREVTYGGDDTIDNLGATEYVISVTTKEDAEFAIAILDDAISKVSTERSKLGAVQNRLEHTINNLGVAAENLTAAESRIRDVDMAKEMMDFARSQILMQAGTAMLAQANMKTQAVLQLLG